MPIDPFAALNALVRAEATRGTAPVPPTGSEQGEEPAGQHSDRETRRPGSAPAAERPTARG
ncbi:hypothetical protein ACFPM3_07140 [Streptomyces coeruleoprunus]|uniref:Uncharacterized protein n=1 Tax=Streptomyces coeruleoprunus TaxID=285563 RepID=A0ABV9XA56_9ACTN